MLDLALAAAAFDQTVRILLIDHGVFLIRSGQNPKMFDYKDVAKIFESLHWHEIETIYVEAESLGEHGLSAEDLSIEVELVQRCDIAELLSCQQVIVNA